MANSGEPNDNTSQFFLTLDKTPELQGKNTMFGRIEGDTIYNLMKMAEADMAQEGGDRPLYPTSITTTEILLNPFDDMVKNMHIAERTKNDSQKAPKKKRKAGKNLLSFGAEDGDDAPAPVVKKAKVNPNFVAAPQESDAVGSAGVSKKPAEAKTKPEKTTRRRSPTKSASPEPQAVEKTTKEKPAPVIRPPSPSPEPPQVTKTISMLEKTNAQIAELKASMKRSTNTAQAVPEKKKSALEAMIPETSTRGRKRGKATDDKGALDMFNAFKQRLGTVSQAPADPKKDGGSKPTQSNTDDTEEPLCDLHFVAGCQSCSAWDKDLDNNSDAEDENDANWMSHTLSFAKDNLGKDLEWKRKMEEFEVIDPREKTKELTQDRKKDRQGGRDWDRQREKGKGKTKT